jgi:hypothetical protein
MGGGKAATFQLDWVSNSLAYIWHYLYFLCREMLTRIKSRRLLELSKTNRLIMQVS